MKKILTAILQVFVFFLDVQMEATKQNVGKIILKIETISGGISLANIKSSKKGTVTPRTIQQNFFPGTSFRNKSIVNIKSHRAGKVQKMTLMITLKIKIEVPMTKAKNVIRRGKIEVQQLQQGLLPKECLYIRFQNRQVNNIVNRNTSFFATFNFLLSVSFTRSGSLVIGSNIVLIGRMKALKKSMRLLLQMHLLLQVHLQIFKKVFGMAIIKSSFSL